MVSNSRQNQGIASGKLGGAGIGIRIRITRGMREELERETGGSVKSRKDFFSSFAQTIV